VGVGRGGDREVDVPLGERKPPELIRAIRGVRRDDVPVGALGPDPAPTDVVAPSQDAIAVQDHPQMT